MRPVVADASVAYKWLAPGRPEEGAQAALDLLQSHFEGLVTIHVPPLLFVEVGNILVCGRAKPSLPVVREAIGALFALPLTVVSLDQRLARTAATLAHRLRLTFHDATYLALAEALSGELVTADRQLVERARARGVVRPLTPKASARRR